MLRLRGRTLDLVRTAVHYFMFAILGLVTAIPGPTLIDLTHSSGTDSHSISYIFTSKSIGYLAGALSGGFILDCMKNEQIALIISSLFVATCSFLIPWCRSLTMLLGTFFITGFAMGFSTTGSNTSCLRMWGRKGAPFLQGLHFIYGCGGFIAPLLAAPFLSAKIPIPINMTVLGVTQNMTDELLSGAQNTTELQLKIPYSEAITIPTITVAFTIIGILATLASGGFIFVYIFSSQDKNTFANDVQANIRDSGLTFSIVVVILACLQTGLMSGVEVSFTQMLTSYAVNSGRNLSKVTASYMTSVFWAAYAVTRGISIILACQVRVKYLLIFDLIISVTAALILVTIGTWSTPALWIGTGILGVGVASVFPASLSLVEKYININNRIASIFTVVCNVLEMTVPLSISMYLESNPNVLFHFITAATISCCVVFISLNIILTRKGEKYDQEKVPSKEKANEKQAKAIEKEQELSNLVINHEVI